MLTPNVTKKQRREIVAECNAKAALTKGYDNVASAAYMREAFGADLVWTCWQDPSQPAGCAVAILKGRDVLQEIKANGRDRHVTVAYLPPSREMAEAAALCLVYGDDRPSRAG